MDDSLSMILLQRIAVVAVIAYIFSHTQAFRSLFKERITLREKGVLTLFFSTVSISGTYFGIPVDGALANVRDTGSVVAGLLCGPLVGTVTGIISGLHRISLGGFTAVECGAATILGGLVAGFIHVRMKPKTPDFVVGALTGVGVVLYSMILILMFSKPFSAAFSLVAKITFPMSLANAVGISVFMVIIHNVRQHQTKIAAVQTHKALRIANAALPYFRQGLNHISANKVASTIVSMTSAAAVAITDREQVLAHVGIADDHHRPHTPLLTAATKACIASGQINIARTAQDIGCAHHDCPLKSAVIVPLLCKDDVVGTLKIYYTREVAITALDIEFAQGLGHIFSTQLELSKLQAKTELAAKAELKALRAQVNPHFLFNALNTIVSQCRTNPEEARNLLIQLSEFFRRSLKSCHDFVTFREELEHIDAYLTLEKARFGDRLKIIKNIEDSVLQMVIPAFILQPLVENAVKHGLLTKETGGTVSITARRLGAAVEIIISDDGVGIPAAILDNVLVYGYGKGAGIGLTNVHERLKNIYGSRSSLSIESAEGAGTTLKIVIPAQAEGVVA